MAFTPGQLTQVLAALDRFPAAALCSVCGDREPVVMNQIYNFTSLDPVGTVDPEPPGNTPHIAVVCRICGHTRYFNAYMLGLRNLVGPSKAEQDAEARARAALPINAPSGQGQR